MRNRITQSGLDIEVRLSSLSDLPPDAHTLIVPYELEAAARQAAPNARVYALAEMVNAPIYDELVHEFDRESA
jgi:mannitol-specific phosphotransferase system IIBC component